MLQLRLAVFAVSVTSLISIVAQAATTTEPAAKLEEAWWKERHESINKRVKEGNVDLIFLGDSITQGWEADGKKPGMSTSAS